MKPMHRSWLSLVTFCAATVLIVALGSALLFAGASLALAVARPGPGDDANEKPAADAAQLQPSADKPAGAEALQPLPAAGPASLQLIDDGGGASGSTFSGVITDSRCDARHSMNSGKTPAECVRSCVGHGAGYVLVDGEKIYALQGEQAQLEKLAGERVNIVGMRDGGTIKVKAVLPG